LLQLRCSSGFGVLIKLRLYDLHLPVMVRSSAFLQATKAIASAMSSVAKPLDLPMTGSFISLGNHSRRELQP
jgi:hypothetical protein